MKYESISIAKAIGIILMVLAHSGFSQYGDTYINMFHMPLFFFFSGYCFKENYLANTKLFIKKKVQGIYLPFVKWSLFFLLLHNLFFYLNIYNGEYGYKGNVSHLYFLNEYIIHATNIVMRMTYQPQLLGGYWFLKTLFWASLISYLFIKKSKSLFLGGGIVLIISLICVFFDLRIPFYSIGAREFLATFFYIIGYYYRYVNWRIEQRRWIIPFGIILVGMGTEYWPSSMITLTWQKILPYSITAIIGTLAVFSFSQFVSVYNNRIKEILKYIGDNTLSILTWHFLCFKLVSLIIIRIYHLPMKRLSEFPVIEEYASSGWWVCYFCVGVCIPLILIYIYKLLCINQKQ